ncbi:Tripartite motif-containing protein 35 Hemopoietic lineage switch protein 5 [Larimichthys crocea]|uniref:Tripartite motif-containing protein 35 Hemopoietic lineage switch protein 5 n=1 Tax=Larimichthys crocea TaxID=215358 RepID=A0A6G0HQL7_LARCR|nr:Tripartite motif-containing protein 35 Hemopoietic lineage switch protein 5 [Larimichthys crocea]
MAGRLSLQEVDLSCPICCEIFKDPVVLKCSHSFCSQCLQEYWRQGRSRDCPLCRTQSLDDPVPSLTLKNLCESYIEESEGLGETGGELYCDPGEMCPLHGERLKLFCLLDKEAICVVCHTSKKHKQHDCCPVSEAVVDVKEKMKSALICLQEKKDAFDKMKKNYEDTVAYIQVQARFVERRTREEFEKLRSFLQAEEEARMDALKMEEEQRSRAMMKEIEKITRDITSVSESIRALEEEIALEGISVLHKCRKTLARSNCPIADPVMDPGALIDVAKYVGSLSFHVWEKMHKIVKYTPVTLDPNTAAPWLVLSDDLTSVCDSDEKQKLPDNPERYDPDTGVLGREGFTSGKRSWDVCVGDNTAWVVGVAKTSVQRKEKVSSVLKNGYLCVYFYHKMYFAGTSPLTRLNLKRNPQRVRVQLDCDKGRVSFYDPLDNTHIYTFKHAITERVFPYFWVGCQQCPLTVEPLEVSVKATEYC